MEKKRDIVNDRGEPSGVQARTRKKKDRERLFGERSSARVEELKAL